MSINVYDFYTKAQEMNGRGQGNHPDDERLISWIGGNLDQKDTAAVKSHIDGCDKCFLRASVFTISMDDLGASDFEVTPDSLLARGMEVISVPTTSQATFEDIQKAAGVIQLSVSRITKLVEQYIERGVNSFFTRPTILALAGSTVIVLLVLSIGLFHPGKDGRKGLSLDNFQNGKPVLPLKHQPQVPSNASDINQSLKTRYAQNRIQVELNGDILIINHLFGASCTVVLATLDGQILHKRQLTGGKLELTLDKYSLQDTTLVRITSMGNIIFENLMYGSILHTLE